MFKKISLRWRMTILNALLIALCCIGLSLLLNASAYKMADTIDASIITPAESNEKSESSSPTSSVVPSTLPTRLKEAKNNYLEKSLFYTGLAVLVGSILTYYISGKILKPLKQLNNQVKNINVNNLNQPLNIPQTKDEIAELTQSFNDMINQLESAFSTQKRFSSDAAHELKTPLTVLQTKVDVFNKKDNHSQKEYEELIKVFNRQIKRLRNLVSELLTMANMENNFEYQDIFLSELLEEVVKDLTPLTEKNNILISLNSKNCFTVGNYNLLYRAFYNLIENAIKYNVQDGNIKIKTSNISSDFIKIIIEDTGIGIKDTDKEHIFEPFYRVDKSRSREMGGTGLGLSLVENIIRKHNGTIIVTDNHKRGSCFTITLPINDKCKRF